jgi:hypothetical protein
VLDLTGFAFRGSCCRNHGLMHHFIPRQLRLPPMRLFAVRFKNQFDVRFSAFRTAKGLVPKIITLIWNLLARERSFFL